MVKVSVIVPVYNLEQTIEKCVESVLNQTYKNFELLLLDDGSKDNSLKVIKKYEKLKNVKVFTQKNHGVSFTRNKGIKEAKGKYITFVDGDDYVDKEYIEKLVDTIEKEKSDIVISGYRRVNEENAILHKINLKNTYWSKYIINTPWGRMFKRDFIVKYNIKFSNLLIGEDIYFNLLAYSYDPKITIIDYIGYNWFYNTKSVSNTILKSLNKKVDCLILLEKIKKSYKIIDEYLSYFLVKYYIWYLLYSGREATKENFILEYKRLKEWYNKNNIFLKFSPFSIKIKGEKLKVRIIVFCFLWIEKLHLIEIFSKIYCKGVKNE